MDKIDTLLKKFNINDIAEKTHISPLTLDKLFNYEFDKLDAIKLKGFVKILEAEYPEYDFSELKEKIDNINVEIKQNEVNNIENIKEHKNNSLKIYFIVIILLIAIGSLIYYMQQNKKKIEKNIEENKQNNSITTEIIAPKEINNSINLEKNITSKPIKENVKQDIENKVETKIIKTKEVNKTLAIIPLQKVWYKITYLDSKKSIEHLTSKEIDINGSKRIFIKFGHGMIKLKCNNKILEPNTTKITRVIIDNCDMNITKKRVSEFK